MDAAGEVDLTAWEQIEVLEVDDVQERHADAAERLRGDVQRQDAGERGEAEPPWTLAMIPVCELVPEYRRFSAPVESTNVPASVPTPYTRMSTRAPLVGSVVERTDRPRRAAAGSR